MSIAPAPVQEKTTHDLFMQWTLWTTVPPLPDLHKNQSSQSKETSTNKDSQQILDDSEEEDIEEIKDKQKPGGMRKIGDFQCFEDFWTVLGKAERPSQIHARGGLFFFRKDVQPSPEDPLNKFGNRYTITFKVEAKDEEGNRKVETKFLHILMTVLGRNFQYCERITGVILQSLMTEVKVSIWSMKMEKEEQDIFEGHIQHTLGKKMKVEKKTIV